MGDSGDAEPAEENGPRAESVGASDAARPHSTWLCSESGEGSCRQGMGELVRVSQTSQSDFESVCPDERDSSQRGHGRRRWDWWVGEREERGE